jgi:hypothetical protein
VRWIDFADRLALPTVTPSALIFTRMSIGAPTARVALASIVNGFQRG